MIETDELSFSLEISGTSPIDRLSFVSDDSLVFEIFDELDSEESLADEEEDDSEVVDDVEWDFDRVTRLDLDEKFVGDVSTSS